jgi:hypothetical protein
MKRWNPLLFTVLVLALPLAAVPAQAAPLEVFTNDYYVANARQWLDKEVTLSVAYFSPANGKFSIEKMEVMDAFTFHNHLNGGHINVVAAPEVFARLKTLCGTHVQREGGWIHTTQIHGIFKQKDSQYYLLVER